MFQFSVAQVPSGTGGWPASAVVWRTCVREIAFVDSRAAVPSGATILHDEDAYAHLLEVICGLDSPMVGETEVLHQFKVFAANIPDDHSAFREVGHQLLADARVVRSRHLIGLGSRSYGSAVRRIVADGACVAVAGTGLLAREIVPFVVRPGRQVDLWGRRPACEGFDAGMTYRRLDVAPPVIDAASSIVIAAPLSSAQIARLGRAYRDVTVLVDLRAEARRIRRLRSRRSSRLLTFLRAWNKRPDPASRASRPRRTTSGVTQEPLRRAPSSTRRGGTTCARKDREPRQLVGAAADSARRTRARRSASSTRD